MFSFILLNDEVTFDPDKINAALIKQLKLMSVKRIDKKEVITLFHQPTNPAPIGLIFEEFRKFYKKVNLDYSIDGRDTYHPKAISYLLVASYILIKRYEKMTQTSINHNTIALLFETAMFIAQKFFDDTEYKALDFTCVLELHVRENKKWSKSHIDNLKSRELAFLKGLDWNVSITEEEFEKTLKELLVSEYKPRLLSEVNPNNFFVAKPLNKEIVKQITGSPYCIDMFNQKIREKAHPFTDVQYDLLEKLSKVNEELRMNTKTIVAAYIYTERYLDNYINKYQNKLQVLGFERVFTSCLWFAAMMFDEHFPRDKGPTDIDSINYELKFALSMDCSLTDISETRAYILDEKISDETFKKYTDFLDPSKQESKMKQMSINPL